MDTVKVCLQEALEVIRELEDKAKELPNPYWEDTAACVRHPLEQALKLLGIPQE